MEGIFCLRKKNKVTSIEDWQKVNWFVKQVRFKDHLLIDGIQLLDQKASLLILPVKRTAGVALKINLRIAIIFLLFSFLDPMSS